MIINELNIIGMQIFVVLAVVGVIYLCSAGIVNYINKILENVEKIKFTLKVDVLSFWMTLIPMVIMFSWTGVMVTIAFAYVFNKKLTKNNF